MDYIVLAIILLKLSTLTHATIFYTEDAPNWGYDYWNGPRTWPMKFAESCSGFSQSPINIRPRRTVFSPNLPPFKFVEKYSPRRAFSVYNAEVTVRINVTGQFYIVNGGLKDIYKTEQIHFHWGDANPIGSEHKFNGRQAPLEMHIVNWAANKYRSSEEASHSPGGITVLSVLFKISKFDNPVLEPIIQALPHIADPDWGTFVHLPIIPLRLLLPKRSHLYYRYYGSFTTPACNEGVIWSVFHNQLPISNRQLHAFRKVLKRDPWKMKHILLKHKLGIHSKEIAGYSLAKSPLVNNFRPVQPLNGRTVYRSFLV